MKEKVLLITMFILGIGIFSFPIFSNWYNNRVQYSMIGEYQEYINGLTLEEITKRLEEAHHFNEALAEGKAAYVDPFSSEDIDHDDINHYPEGFEYNHTMGSIEIPKIDVNLPIIFGVTDDVLARGVGYLPNTSLPVGGTSSHSVLTGHRGLASAELFHNLDLVEVGDVFYIKILGQTLAYEVDRIKIVEPTEVEDLQIEYGKDYLTLITCHPYMINSQRLLVRGHQIEYVEPIETNALEMFLSRYQEYIIVAGILTAVGIGTGIHRRKKEMKKEMKKDE